MTLPWFWLLWLVAGLGCTGIGLWLTERRTRVTRLVRGSRGLFCCCACGMPCEPDARFCGACGRSLRRSARNRHERMSSSC